MQKGDFQSVIKRFGGLVAATVFPLFCLSCKQEGSALCASCRENIPMPGVFLDMQGEVLQSVRALDTYGENEILAEVVKQLKYGGMHALREGVFQMVSQFFFAHQMQVDMVTAVPLHPRRRAERGFNQAEMIGRAVAEVLGVPYQPLLKRTRYTKQQTKLGREERLKNMKGVFTLRGPVSAGMRVLLVDDVYTTGATMQAAAAQLHCSGVDDVHGFVLAVEI